MQTVLTVLLIIGGIAWIFTDGPIYDEGSECFTKLDQRVIIIESDFDAFDQPSYIVLGEEGQKYEIKEDQIKHCSRSLKLSDAFDEMEDK